VRSSGATVAGVTQRFLILHGLGGSSLDHWQTWLAGRLGRLGAWVSYPEFPDSDNPSQRAWEQALERELAQLAAGAGERVVLCHSLGAVLWLRHSLRIEPTQRADRVLLVAPPGGPEADPAIVDFFPIGADGASVTVAAARTLLVCSDNDPYCPAGAASVYGELLGIETEVIPGGGHLNPDAGYGPWPHVEAWCLGVRPGVAW
jgi:predicted alpha/beta hydrolase family esterase